MKVSTADQPIVGWRQWRWDDYGGLRSMTRAEYWPGMKPLVAGCTFGRLWMRKHEDAPDVLCTCGIYAIPRRSALPFAFAHMPTFAVMGRVALWGTVVEHESGWRAQYAYPQAFYLTEEQTLIAPELRKRFGVPVLHAADLAPEVIVKEPRPTDFRRLVDRFGDLFR